MATKGSRKKVTRRRKAWNPRTAIKPNRKERAALDELERVFTTPQIRRLEASLPRIDRAFIEEKAELVRDTLVEIQRHRKRTPNILLQRNVWSSLDAIALELDQSGFTTAFKKVAPKFLKSVQLDNPDLVSLEWKMMRSFLGVNEREAATLGLPFSEIQEVIQYAEKMKFENCALGYIESEEFSFRDFFARACGRPDQILEIHNSPQAKVFVAIVIGIINVIALLWGVIPLAIVTVIVMLIVAACGC